MSNPSAFEQLTLEYLNQARMDPQGEFDRFITSTSPIQAIETKITQALNWFGVDLDLYQQQIAGLQAVAPLAWNGLLGNVATAHSQLMIAQDTQSHQLAGEASLGSRISASGYTGWNRLAENIYAYSESPAYAHAGFFIDWGYGPGGIQSPAGHRNNIMNADLTEVGIGVVEDRSGSTDVGPYVVTQDFGHRFAYKAQFVGVAYDDDDANDFYSMGEGSGGITVTLTPASGGSSSTVTQAAGGYGIEGTAGGNTLTFSGGGLSASVSVELEFGSQNVKVDLVDGDTILSSVDTTLGSGAVNLGLLGQFSTSGDGNGLANRIEGNNGQNMLKGYAGNDTLTGEGGNDAIFGNPGDDFIWGGSGGDWLHGGKDDDWLDGESGDDTVFGGLGQDSLQGGDDADRVFGNHGDDSLVGGGGNDWLHGGKDNDTVDGGTGDDSVFGGVGNDVLSGGEGADLITGNAGRDVLDGGPGNDVFDYNAVLDSAAGATTRDVIVGGFDNPGPASGDQIDVSDIAIFAFLGTGSFSAGGHAELRLEAGAGQAIIQGDTDGNGFADLEIVIEDVLAQAFTADDFIGLI